MISVRVSRYIIRKITNLIVIYNMFIPHYVFSVDDIVMNQLNPTVCEFLLFYYRGWSYVVKLLFMGFIILV